MDIRQLTYFLEVAKAGSYSLAARRLNITQPTLSIAVKRLEEELGVELFYAFGRRQQLTTEGERLLAGAQKLMEVYQETLDDVGRSGPESPGSITLGLPPLIGSCFFSELIPEFAQTHPNVKISIIEEGARKLEHMMLDGLLDVACTIVPRPNPALETRLLTRRRNMVLLHHGHPLAGRPALRLAELRNERFAIFNEDFVLHHQILSACRHAGFQPHVVLLSSQWDFMMEIVAQNRGVSVLPKPILDKHPNPEVACVLLEDEVKYWDIFLLWNRDRYLSNACRAFIELTTRRFSDAACEE